MVRNSRMSFSFADIHPWLKALHVISVIAWMAALLYLPRLYHYHQLENAAGRDVQQLFTTMESRLLRIIGTPAMMAAWGFGLLLVSVPGLVDWGEVWPWVKLAGILAMTWFHFWLAGRRRELERGECTISARRFKLLNEIPSVLIVVIVIMVIVRPF